MDKITLEMKTVEEAVSEALKVLNATKDEVEIIVEEEPSKGFLGLGAKNATVTVVRRDAKDSESLIANSLDEKENNRDLIDKFGDKLDDFVDDAKDFISSTTDKAKELYDDASEKIEDGIDKLKDKDEKKKSRPRRSQLLDDIEVITDDEEIIEMTRVFLEDLVIKMGFDGKVEVIDERTEEENVVLDIVLDDYNLNSRLIGKRGDTLNAISYICGQFIRSRYEGDLIIEVDCGDYVYSHKEDIRSIARKCAERAINDGEYRMRPMNPYDRRIAHKEISKIEGVSTHSEGEEPRRAIVITRDPQ